MHSNNQNFIDLKQYITDHMRTRFKIIRYDIHILQTYLRIDAKDLVQYITYDDENVVEIVQKYNFVTKTNDDRKWNTSNVYVDSSSFPSDRILNIFIGYLIRYEISKIMKLDFMIRR